MSGTQRIGWDPRHKQIRSWVFDSDGGFSEGFWSRDGERWVMKSTGVLKDGRAASATNVLTRVNRDTMNWTSVDRTSEPRSCPTPRRSPSSGSRRSLARPALATKPAQPGRPQQ